MSSRTTWMPFASHFYREPFMTFSSLGRTLLIAHPPARSAMKDEVSQVRIASAPQYTPNMKF